jgi:anti-anti-sigma factor
MASTLYDMTATVTIPAGEPGAQTELVRGHEQWLLEMVAPLVRQQSVSLDLSGVEHIDAAGITTLISLYRCAHDAGHFFTICNASRKVVEMLALVGLDRILLSRNVVTNSHSGISFERPAA